MPTAKQAPTYTKDELIRMWAAEQIMMAFAARSYTDSIEELITTAQQLVAYVQKG